MGYSLSWAAVNGGTLETVCSILGVRPTGQREGIPESDILGAQLPNGWYLLLLNRNVIEDQILEGLSRQGEVIHCFVEDHVMFSTASGWRNRKELWRVTHDGGEKGVFHLEIKGEPPIGFESIREHLLSKQESEGGEKAGADFVYDIPAELAKELTGFRHDEDMPGMSGDVFHVLEPAKETADKRGFWSSFKKRLGGGTN